MAKYAYAPLSVDENRRRAHKDDDAVNERMPMCVGICVLLAIVYVLSRTGGNDAVMHQQPGSIRSAPPTVPASTTPITQDPLSSGSTTATGGNTVPTQTQPTTTTTTYKQQNENTAHYTSPVVNTPPVAVSTPVTEDETPRTTATGTDCECDCSNTDSTSSTSTTDSDGDEDDDLLAKLREKALQQTPPGIIECAGAEEGQDQTACHLPSKDRYAALGQKGATLWMTGCSGSGKTTVATALEDMLVKEYGKHVYRLDGDNIRTGLNRDLGFSASDRAESVRRVGEMAALFSDAGVITLVGLISPYAADRDAVRERHAQLGIPFYEIFVDAPPEEREKNDPKGLYEKVRKGEIKHFTCIDDPYDDPEHPEIVLKTFHNTVEESVNILFRRLERDGILIGAPKVTPPGLPNPDGDEIIDLHVPAELKNERMMEALTLPKVLITDIDLNWLQVIGEGWASPLKGFMREGALLETLHFNSVLVDPFNLTGNVDRLQTKTNFEDFPEHQPPSRVSMSIPITLSCTNYTKTAIGGASAVALVTQMGQTVAILRNPEVYNNRKEEIVTRMYGVIDPGHPYISHIYSGGDYLIGGEVELLDRIRYNDGLDQWRKTVTELLDEFKEKGADTVYAFQTRNPTHAGHAYLMKTAGEDLRKKGYEKPVLWLSPLGGWTKPDDVPLDVRVKQHEEVLNAGLTHPGGLDPDSTVMAIWPAPMVYAGPTEVEFHAKSRRSAGASYFVVGRDPAGMKGSMEAVTYPDDDLYDGNHGRYVLQNSPGIGDMKMLSFVKVMYDIKDNTMKVPDSNREDDFISISGTKMRLLARQGAHPCSETNIPTDLEEANCIPAGFMVPKGWDLVVDYYKNAADEGRWIPWSKPWVTPLTDSRTAMYGKFGSSTFELRHKDYDSFWHDIPMRPSDDTDKTIINLVTEIPMFMTAKMEVIKERKHNVIAQDTNKDGSPRYYTYGTPFFNYGLIPRTWEDPAVKSPLGHVSDNDPLDVMEFGSEPLPMGSITPCRVLGSLELIDEGETDHKIICIALQDRDADKIHSMDDLERVKPGTLNQLREWLTKYKTSDGKPANSLASETPKTVQEALSIIDETHERWRMMCGHGTSSSSVSSSASNEFWLDSAGCRGN